MIREVFSKFMSERTNDADIDQFPLLGHEIVKTSEEHFRYQRVWKYVLTATFGVNFWATESSLQEQELRAKRALIHGLYGEFLQEISRIELAAEGGSKKEIMEACERIKKKIQV